MAKKKASRNDSVPASGASAVTRASAWPRYAAAAVLGLVAYVLIGVVPLPGGIVARAVVAGAVVALAARRTVDIAWLSLASVASGLLGAVVCTPWSLTLAQYRVPGIELIAAICVAPAVTAGVAWLRVVSGRTWASVVALLLVGAVFLFSIGVLPGPQADTFRQRSQQLAVEPPAEQYSFDAYIFLKTSFIMDRGVPYYEAFLEAFDSDARLQGRPLGLFNVRQPWIYYAWSVLPGQQGAKLLGWFTVLALGTAATTFWGLRDVLDDSAALTAAAAVLGYMGFAAISMWFPLSEFWAGCLALCAVMAMVRRRPYVAAVLVVVAFSFRELAAWVMPVYVAWWFFSGERKKWWPALVIAIAGPVGLYIAHASMSPVNERVAADMGLWTQGGLGSMFKALRFSGDLVPGRAWLYPLAVVCAAVGSVLVRDRAIRAAALAAVISIGALLGLFTSGLWGEYWGAIGMPAILALSLLVFGPVTAREPASFLLQVPDSGDAGR